MQDALTCGLVFMLYTLFQRVSVIKPYTVDFSSNRQYLVCIGLKQRRPIEVIRQLATLLQFLGDREDLKLAKSQRLVGLLEDENNFLSQVRSNNT